MSKYTTEVRFICEESAGLTHSEGYSSIDSILDKARDKVFDFYFPIFDENYRSTLENKILKHYYTREIGFETVGLWKHFLNTRLNEIMPYYNQLYLSELIKFNPLYDVDLTTDYNKINNGTNDKSSAYHEQSEFEQNGAFVQDGSYSENGSTNQHKSDNETTSTNEIANSIEENNLAETENNTNTQNKIGEETATINEVGNVTSHSETDSIKNSNDTKNNSGHTTDNTTITNINDHWEYFSDTPEGGINGLDPATSALGQNNYLTNATHITDNGTGSTNNKTIDNSNDEAITREESGNSTENTSGTETKDNISNKDSNENITSAGDANKNSNSVTEKDGSKETNTVGAGESDITSSGNKVGNDNKTGSDTKAGTDVKHGSTNSNETINNIEDYLHHVVGKSGGVSYSKLLNEYRDTFLNIDMLIIKDLRDLFMCVW